MQDIEVMKAELNRHGDEKRVELEQELSALAAKAASERSAMGLELSRRAAEMERSEEDLAVRFKMIEDAQVCCGGRGILSWQPDA